MTEKLHVFSAMCQQVMHERRMGDRSYRYFGYSGNNQKSFEEANSVCRDLNANLVTISNSAENQLVLDLCREVLPGQQQLGWELMA